MADQYYGVEPYTGKIIRHFGTPGMKWGWTKDGKKTGAKEAMTEQERAQRRKDLIKKIGAGVGTAAAIGGTVLAIKNRKKIGTAVGNAKKYFTKKNIFGKTKFNKDISKAGLRLSKLGKSAKSNTIRFGTSAGLRLSNLGKSAKSNALNIRDKASNGINNLSTKISNAKIKYYNNQIKGIRSGNLPLSMKLKNTVSDRFDSIKKSTSSGLSSLKNKAQANAMRGYYTAKSFKKGGLSGAREFLKKSSKYMKR